MTNVAAWRKVTCPKCDAPVGARCGPNRMFMGFRFIKPSGYVHVARIAAGKKAQGKRNNRKGNVK